MKLNWYTKKQEILILKLGKSSSIQKKSQKIKKKFFYLKQEVNGIYGKVAWWAYCGDEEIKIEEFDYGGSNEKIICFPSEAKKEISLLRKDDTKVIFQMDLINILVY